MITIYDDLVPLDYQNHLESVLLSPTFPWFFWHKAIPDVLKKTNRVDGTQYLNTKQMKHVFSTKDKKTPEYHLIEPLVDMYLKKTGEELIKIHAAAVIMQHPIQETKVVTPHVDFDYTISESSELKSLIYYVTDSDGDTILYNECCGEIPLHELTECDRAKYKRGRAATFRSNQFHSGSMPTKGVRVLINVIMEIKK